jgi:hypothetical protein
VISISETRHLATLHPELRDELLALIASAETLRDVHEAECGCGRPGNPSACTWPKPDGELLAGFDFDEVAAT